MFKKNNQGLKKKYFTYTKSVLLASVELTFHDLPNNMEITRSCKGSGLLECYVSRKVSTYYNTALSSEKVVTTTKTTPATHRS